MTMAAATPATARPATTAPTMLSEFRMSVDLPVGANSPGPPVSLQSSRESHGPWSAAWIVFSVSGLYFPSTSTPRAA